MPTGRVVVKALSLSIAAAVMACVPSSLALGAQTSAQAPTLTFGENTLPGPNLNPADDDGPISLSLLAYAAIVHENGDGSFSPGLATSWHYVGGDNETFEFTLRQGAHFSDGTEVTASAVKTWIDYFANAKGPFVEELNLKSVSTNGEWTVVMHEKSPTPELETILAGDVGYVASPKAVADPSSLDVGTDGAGPYMVVPSQSIANSQYSLVPNPYYYDPSAIRFSKVLVKIISQPSTMLEAIRSGQLEVAQGDSTTVSAAQAAGLTVVAEPGGSDQILILDRGKQAAGGSANPLASVQVRQALNYAIDRKAIAQAIAGRYGTTTDEIGSRDGFDASVQDYYPYDPAKAKSLLAAAGYAKGFSLNLPSQTTFGTLADPTMDAVAQDFAAVGVKLNVISTTALTQWVNDVLGGMYPVAGFEATAFPPLSEWYGFWFAPNGIENQHGWVDPTMDKLYQEGTVSSAPSVYWKAISRRTVMQADTIPLFDFDAFWFTTKRIGGVSFSAIDGEPDPTGWYINS